MGVSENPNWSNSENCALPNLLYITQINLIGHHLHLYTCNSLLSTFVIGIAEVLVGLEVSLRTDLTLVAGHHPAVVLAGLHLVARGAGLTQVFGAQLVHGWLLVGINYLRGRRM